jgi:microcystin-dependent protein
MGITLDHLTYALNKIKDYCANKYTHENIEVLDRFSLDEETGELLFDGKLIEGSGGKIDESILEIIEQNAATLATINKYQKYVNVDLDSCFCKLAKNYTPIVGEYVPFIKTSGSFEVKESRVVIKPGQRVQINVLLSYTGNSSAANIAYMIKDYTNNTDIAGMNPYAGDKSCEYSYSQSCQYANETNEDCEIGLIVTVIGLSDTLESSLCTMTVQEINRQIVIDPVEYVDSTQGLEDTPVGHILSHMGNKAPKHYLVCDGSTYNIADYPYLATHILNEFGSYNYFGGDGTTTFGIPDLRGEFLRGTGTATRDAGSGSEVGEHQDGTSLVNLGTQWNGIIYQPSKVNNATNTSNNVNTTNIDKITSVVNYKFDHMYTNNSIPAAKSLTATYTTRPTNTSVLYCIKYEPTYFMNVSGDANGFYTDEEITNVINELWQE